MKVIICLTVMAMFLIFIAGCTTTQQGASIGGLGGAGLGAIIGNQIAHQSWAGAAIGGVGGALAGALIGSQME
jgi:hypothetical protein